MVRQHADRVRGLVRFRRRFRRPDGCAAPADDQHGHRGHHQQGAGREADRQAAEVPLSPPELSATGSADTEGSADCSSGVSLAVGVVPRSGSAGSFASSVRATARDTGSMSVPAWYIPPKAFTPCAVSFAGASVTFARPLTALRPLAVKVTSGTFLPVKSAPAPSVLVTSA
jgi:hypothetical protein